MARHKENKVEHIDLVKEREANKDDGLMKLLIGLQIFIAFIQLYLVQILLSIGDALTVLSGAIR